MTTPTKKRKPKGAQDHIVVPLADGVAMRIDFEIAEDVNPKVPPVVTGPIKDLAETLGRTNELWSEDPAIGAHIVQNTAAFTDVVTKGLETPSDVYAKLSKRHRAVVLNSIADIAGTLAEAAFLEDIEVKDLAARAQVASDTFRLITKASPDQLEALSDAIAPIVELDPAQTSDEDAEAAGRVLIRQLHERLVRQSYSVRELAELGPSRQRLSQLRKEGRLFALHLPYKRSLLYPRWQFDGDLRPRPEMPELIAAATAAGLEPVDFQVLMTNVEAGDGTTPVELLDNGRHDVVLRIIAAANAHGA